MDAFKSLVWLLRMTYTYMQISTCTQTMACTPKNQKWAWRLRHEIQSDLFFHVFMQSNNSFSSYFPLTVFVTTHVYIRKHSLTRTMTILLYSGRTSREVRQDFSRRYINCDWWQRDRVAPHWPYQGYVGQFSHKCILDSWKYDAVSQIALSLCVLPELCVSAASFLFFFGLLLKSAVIVRAFTVILWSILQIFLYFSDYELQLMFQNIQL